MNEVIYDLGCGTGEFLNYCRSKNIPAVGFDSNSFLVEMNLKNGLNTEYADILEIHKKDYLIHYAICDNVLEHLSEDQLISLFRNLKKVFVKGGILLIIVPCEKGFKSDPTHKTFVDLGLMKSICYKHNLHLESSSYLPLNISFFNQLLYLQMSIFKIVF